MIPQETVDKILESSRVEDVISDFISLKRSGSGFTACCPFHNEKTPSFHVSPAKGIYKCFGCGKAGNAVNFVMEMEALSYPEALKYLAKKYGIPVVEKEESAEEIQEKQHKESLYIVSEFASKYFANNLKEGEGKNIGYAYFKERGLEDSTIEKYALGWAIRDGKDLFKKALEAGYKEEYLLSTGLCYQNDKGELHDRFYDRVMFPIHSASGRVIAFGGRTLRSGHVSMKYVNTPTTDIYIKEKSLYGIYFAKAEMAKKNKCYLVEGYLDVLSFHQLGILNTVASSGTSLTIEQVRLIKRFCQNITIIYDGDSAGIKAAVRAIDLILQEGLNVKVVLIPDGDDPDSFSRKHNLEEVLHFLENNEQDFISYRKHLLGDEIADPLKKIELINEISQSISLIPEAIQRTVFSQQASEVFNIDKELIIDSVNKTRSKAIDKELRNYQKYRENNRDNTQQTAIITNQDNNQAHNDTTNSQSNNLQNIILAAIEKDLLWFILNEGLTEINFPKDSEFSEDNGIVVADFIRGHMENDDYTFENIIYRDVYDAYFKLYDEDESLSQNDIIHKLINSAKQSISQIVIDLTERKHQISINYLKASMTNINTTLSTYVPKAIIMYHIKRLIHRSKELTKSLSAETDSDKQISLLLDIQELANKRKILEEKLSKII